MNTFRCQDVIKKKNTKIILIITLIYKQVGHLILFVVFYWIWCRYRGVDMKERRREGARALSRIRKTCSQLHSTYDQRQPIRPLDHPRQQIEALLVFVQQGHSQKYIGGWWMEYCFHNNVFLFCICSI